MNKKKLIICGYSRSGTTYLYNILKSTNKFSCYGRKELRYFVDENFNLKSKLNQKLSYESYFNYKMYNYSLDSTPDYIHNKRFVDEFKKDKGIKAILIERELDDRLESWRCYSINKKLIENCNIKEFKNLQVRHDTNNTPPHLSVIYNSLYKNYKERLISIDKNRVLEINFNDLKDNIDNVIRKISDFIKIELNEYNLSQNINSSKNIKIWNKYPTITFMKNKFKSILYLIFKNVKK